MIEYMFNMQGNPRKKQQREVNRFYTQSNIVESGFGGALWREISNFIPVV